MHSTYSSVVEEMGVISIHQSARALQRRRPKASPTVAVEAPWGGERATLLRLDLRKMTTEEPNRDKVVNDHEQRLWPG